MFLNITPCYNICLNPNETLYLEVRNESKLFVYIFLQYKFNGKIFTKQSPVFGPGKFERLTFPHDALEVLFRVYNCKTVPPDILCSRIILDNISTCYKLIVTEHGIECVRIPC